MTKVLMIALSLGIFAIAGIAIQAAAEARPCVKAPKNYLPCPVTLQRPQPDKAGSN